MKLRLMLLPLMMLIAPYAEAKSIQLEWREIKGAVHYEIQVEKSGKLVAHQVQDKTTWTGELPGGVYSWQIRAIDRTKRPGVWSDPRPVVVMALAPELLRPKDGADKIHFNPQAGTVFKWKAVPGISKYEFVLKNGEKTVLKQDVSALETEVPALPPGKYTWSVQSVMEPGKRAPAAFTGKRWESEASETRELTIALQKLEAPTPVYPIGLLAPPANRKLRFQWKAVEGAHFYQITLSKKVDSRAPASVATIMTSPTTQIYRAEGNSMDIPIPATAPSGDYEWQVRAVANDDSKVAATNLGPESRAAFRLDPNAAFVDGTGYLAFSTMFAPYTYEAVSPSNHTAGKVATAATAATGRISGEYWLRPKVAVAAGVDSTLFTMNNSIYNRLSFEMQAKYRTTPSAGRLGWSWSPKAGLEGRQYLMLTTTPSAMPGAASTFSSLKLMAVGPDVGVDLRMQYSEHWSLGVKFAYFVPLMLTGGPAGSQLSGDSSYRNLSLGAQTLYWLNHRWGVGLGAFFDNRSISYTTPQSALSEKISMDGTYLFGSLIYNLGK